MARPLKRVGIPATSQGMVRFPAHSLRPYLPQIHNDLTFRISNGAQFGGGQAKYESVYCYREENGFIDLPRHYANQMEIDIDIEDRRAVGEKINVKFRGKLEETSTRNQVAAAAALLSTDGGLIAVRTGFGKTPTAIYCGTRRARRTLIIVPTTILLNQWIKQICKFTNLSKDDVGVVQGKRCDWEKPFIVGMVQSLYDSWRPNGLYESTGVVIADEAHTMSAPAFSQAIPKFLGKTRWGLSATPKRKDGLHRIFEYHVGPIVYTFLDQELRATVYAVRTTTQLESRQYKNPWNSQTNRSRLLNALADDEERNRLIARHIHSAYKAGRKILAVSRRNEQFITLRQMLENMAVPANRMGVIVGEGKVTSEVMRRRERILRDARVIFANEQIGGVGLDEPSLNTLVYCLPSQSVDQPCGRITRAYEGKDDYFPRVVDLVDPMEILQRMFASRCKDYKRLGYPVKFVTL